MVPDNGYATPASVDGEHKIFSVANTKSNGHSSATFQSSELTTIVNDFGTKRIKKMGEQYSNSLNDFDVFRNKRRKLGTKTDSNTWNEKHKPHQISDLAVHPKKVEEVKTWLLNSSGINGTNNSSLYGVNNNILLLTGPPGCGKTATVQVLSRELKFSIQEWTNPLSSIEFQKTDDEFSDKVMRDFIPKDDTVRYESQVKAFDNFMNRANRYDILPGLELQQIKQHFDAKESHRKHGKVVVIEELPAFAYKDINQFHSILKRYHSSCHRSRSPLVIIQSEMKSAGNKEDPVRKLFPPEFILENRIHHIQFNSISATNMLKSLTAVTMIESSNCPKSFHIPDKGSLTALANSVNGDIRAAINALQFACINNEVASSDLKQQFDGYTTLCSSNSTNAKKKKLNEKIHSEKINSNIKNRLAAIGGKDPTIDLFHAIGKVLYCKREGEENAQSAASDFDLLPRKLQHPKTNITYERRKLKINPEELLEHIPMSGPGAFTAFLHHSYLDFFGGSNGIHEVADAAESLSYADPFFNEWVSNGKISLSEYGGLITIRGLCHSSPNMTRNATGMKKFHKPEWYNVMAKSKSNNSILSNHFRDRCLTNKEMLTVFAPTISQLFPKSIGSSILEAVGYYSKNVDKYIPYKNVPSSNDIPKVGSLMSICGVEGDIDPDDILIEEFE